MAIRHWIIACLALGFLALAGIAVRANHNAQSDGEPSTTKSAAHNIPELVVPDDGPDDDSLALAPDVDDEGNIDDEADGLFEDSPFAPGG
jgi:hypothetical protein